MISVRAIIVGVILIVLSLVLGSGYHLFDHIRNFDKVFHITGGVIAAWFFANVYKKDFSAGQWSRLRYALAVVGSVMLIGILWEFAEELSSIFSPRFFPIVYRYFYEGNLTDTLGDLVADLTGGLLYVYLLLG